MIISSTNQQRQEEEYYNNNNCTICNKPNTLKKLPDDFQVKKGFISYFCLNCCQVINYLHKNV